MKELLDNMRNANYNFWTAFLTINGIVLSIVLIAILSNLIKSDLAYILLVLNIISIILLLINFKTTKSFYYKMGRYTEEQVLSFTEKDRKRELDKADKLHNWRKIRDVSIQIIFFIELLLIILIIWEFRNGETLIHWF